MTEDAREKLLELVQAAHSVRCGRWEAASAQARLSRAFRALGINTAEDCKTILAAYPQIAPPQDVVERARKVADNWYRRDQHWHEPLAKQIAAFATAHAAREREACARVADAAASDWDITRSGPKSIAAAIRARKP